MPLIPSNFAANSLTGTVRVSSGYANVVLTVSKYAFEDRTKTFTLKLRRDSTEGPVIAQSNLVTLTDFSEIVSLTANTGTVAEGNLVNFTLVTANVVNGANVFFSVLPVTANITAGDFFGANTGRVTINGNQGTFALYANADYSLVDETGETFKVQIRTVEPTGNIVFVSSNVAITDFFKRINVFRFEESSRSIVEGTSVTFTVFAQNLTAGTLLYYYTTGNAGISGSNTGSIAMNSVSNTITITSSSTVPANESRSFSLVLSESNLGPAIATSNAITVVDSALAYLNATGGTVSTIDGFRIHTFTSSNTFSITNFATASFNTANVLVVAGGGGGSIGINNNRPGGAGGGGGFVSQTSIPFSSTGTYTITVGAGGAGLTWEPQPSYVGANGGNSTITAAGSFANVIAVGGGGGGGAPYNLPGRNGGSGGGGYTAGGGFGFPSPTQQGFPGGSLLAHPQAVVWQGGGGAGGQGLEGAPPSWGVPAAAEPTFSPFRRIAFGGPGANSNITGSNVTYAGGGGGGNDNGGTNDGGAGGGGYSSYNSVGPSAPSFPAAGVNGTVNRGGGGGAGWTANAGSGGSGIVIIRYPWRPPAFYSSVTANAIALLHGSNTFFVVNTRFANAVSLFYDTVGNVTSALFVGGNTGSFTVTSNATVLRLQTVANVPNAETRNFQIRIREDSVTGNIVLISSEVAIVGNNYPQQYTQATGGTETLSGGYKVHTFTTSGNLTVSSLGIDFVEYLIVGGGGAGGRNGGGPGFGGGGGGAGGVLLSNIMLTSTGNTVITIGAGGSLVDFNSWPNPPGGNTTVTFAGTSTMIAYGGGGGAHSWPAHGTGFGPARSGGSGGGGVFAGGTQGSGTPGQGFAGGTTSPITFGGATSPRDWGGGGGGAGEIGHWNPSDPSGSAPTSTSAGGNGISISWAPPAYGTSGPTPGRWFAGGGGGGGSPTGTALTLSGGAGGGGAGGTSEPAATYPTSARALGIANGGFDGGANATVNTGGGGGGAGSGGASSGTGLAGQGGSGIVIIRYPYA